MTVPLSHRHYRKRILTIWFVGVLLYALDFGIKRLPHWRPPISVLTPLDVHIPFIPAWVWVYLFLWWAFIFGGGAYYLWHVQHHATRLRQGLLAVLIMQLGAWSIHRLIPTCMPRPPLPPDGSLSLELVRLVYTVDPPTHAFPSLHVASTVVIGYFLMFHIPHLTHHQRRVIQCISIAAIVLISLSTLFIKQHGVLDVLGGLIWGLMAARAGISLGKRWLRFPPRRLRHASAQPAA